MRGLNLKVSSTLAMVLVVGLLLTSASISIASADAKRPIKIGVVQWADTVAPAHIVKYVIENYFDQPCDMNITTKDLSYVGVARGDFDLTFSVWLPNADFRHVYRFRHRLETLPTAYYYNAVLGLYVPDYMPEDSIDDLADPEVAKKYGKEIIGIDPGSSLMTMTREDVIPGYDLSQLYELKAASGPAMTAALGKAYKKEEPVVVTLWAPHWALSKFNVHKLEDPKGLYGAPDRIYMAVHKGFRQEFPEISQFLVSMEFNTIDFPGAKHEHPAKVAFTHDWLAGAMLMVEEGMSLEEMAQAWVKKHEKAVEAWIQGKSWTPEKGTF